MSYKVYTAENSGIPRDHIAIFVEREEDGPGAGGTFDFQGNVAVNGGGMTYHEHKSDDPVNSPTYVEGSKKLIGVVKKTDLDIFRTICQDVEVPGPQVKLSGRPTDYTKPVRRCTEWSQEAVEMLLGMDIVQ